MKVLLIDDHPLILAAIRYVIRDLGQEVQVIGVESGAGARALLQRDPLYDLVLLDLQLGDIPGFDLLAYLRAEHPAIPVVVISGSERASDVIRAIDGGAMGFVPKRASTELLFDALHLVLAGGIYVPPMAHLPSDDGKALPVVDTGPLSPESRSAVVAFDLDGSAPAPTRAPAPSPAVPLAVEGLGLTSRQCEVLQLLLQGKANKVIARELNLSVETVKDHVAAVLRSLGVNSRTQAVLAVSQMQEGGRQALRPVRG